MKSAVWIKFWLDYLIWFFQPVKSIFQGLCCIYSLLAKEKHSLSLILSSLCLILVVAELRVKCNISFLKISSGHIWPDHLRLDCCFPTWLRDSYGFLIFIPLLFHKGLICGGAPVHRFSPWFLHSYHGPLKLTFSSGGHPCHSRFTEETLLFFSQHLLNKTYNQLCFKPFQNFVLLCYVFFFPDDACIL